MDHRHHWELALTGKPETLDALTNLFTGEPASIVREGAPVMRSPHFNHFDDPSQVRTTAERLLKQAVALLNIFSHSHEHVGLGHLNCPKEDGTYHGQSVLMSWNIRTFSQEDAERIARDGERLASGAGAQLMQIAQQSDRVAEVLAFMSSDFSEWSSIYAAIEAIALDLRDRGVAGRDWSAIADRRWATSSELELLKRTANMYRHARQWEPPKPPMFLVNAQFLAKKVARQWLDSLVPAA